MKPNIKLKYIIALAVAAAFVAAIAIIGAFAVSDSIEPEPEFKPAAFNIAMIGPITGDASYIGLSAQQGIQLAVDEINAAGGADGVPISLQIKDDNGSSAKALEAYNELKKSNMSAIIGPLTNVAALEVDKKAQNDLLVRILPTATAEGCTSGKGTFRMCLTNKAQGEALAKLLKHEKKMKAATLYDVSVDYSKDINDAFVEKYQALGGYVVANESYSKGDTDYSHQLKRIKDSGAVVLVLPDYYTEVEKITKQAAALGLKIEYLGTDSWYGIVEQLNGKTNNIEGARFISSIVSTDTENDLVSAFVAAYKAKYGVEPDNYAASAYDAVYALKTAMENARGTYSAADILKAMHKMTYQGVSGSYTFDDDGEPVVTPKLAGIKNGAYVPMN